MNRFQFIPMILVAAMTLSSTTASVATAGGCLTGKSCVKSEKTCCPQCDHACYTCKLEAEVVDVEKKCFEVECKTICIPKVVFPWQKKKHDCRSCDSCSGRGCTNCVHNGAKIRKIKVLKSKKYTCPECEYTWTPKEGASCCGENCCGENCGSDCCESGCDDGCSVGCDAGCDMGMIYADVPTPVTYQPAETLPYTTADDSVSDMVVPTAPQPGQMFAPVDVQTP